MSDVPVSPKANRLASPSWLDTRLVLGVLLVLVSVVVGARVLSAADSTQPVWKAARDLSVGTTLVAGDLVREQVRLSDAQTALLLRAPQGQDDLYLGQALSRPVGAGELVPLRALRGPAERDERLFTLNVGLGHFPPDLRKGQVLDVYVTPGRDAAQAGAGASPEPGAAPANGTPLSATGSRQVLAGVTVDDVDRGESGLGGGGDGVRVVLILAPRDVLAMVTATAQGQIDLVRVRGVQSGSPEESAPVPSASPSGAAG